MWTCFLLNHALSVLRYQTSKLMVISTHSPLPFPVTTLNNLLCVQAFKVCSRDQWARVVTEHGPVLLDILLPCVKGIRKIVARRHYRGGILSIIVTKRDNLKGVYNKELNGLFIYTLSYI